MRTSFLALSYSVDKRNILVGMHFGNIGRGSSRFKRLSVEELDLTAVSKSCAHLIAQKVDKHFGNADILRPCARIRNKETAVGTDVTSFTRWRAKVLVRVKRNGNTAIVRQIFTQGKFAIRIDFVINFNFVKIA